MAASNSKGRAALTAGKGRHQFKSSALLLSMVALPRSQTRSIWGRLESMLTVPRTRSPTLVSPCRTGTALTVPCATAISVASYWTARTLLFPTRPASTLLISACPGEFGMAWTSILRSTISMTSATGKPRTIWSLESYSDCWCKVPCSRDPRLPDRFYSRDHISPGRKVTEYDRLSIPHPLGVWRPGRTFRAWPVMPPAVNVTVIGCD